MTTSDPRLDALQRYAEGEASAADVAQLEQAIANDPAFRSLVVQYLHIDSALDEFATAEPVEATSAVMPAPVAALSRRAWLYLAVAAVLVLGGASLLMRSLFFHSPPPIARAGVDVEVLEATNAKAAAAATALRLGDRLRLGALRLTAGSVSLRLAGKVQLVASAPCDLRFLTAMHMRVLQGKVTVDAGEHGSGFVVETDRARIVDLDTRFGVDVGPASETDVVVFAGRVEVQRPTTGRRTGALIANLQEGEAVRLGPETEPARIEFIRTGARDEDWSARSDPPPGAVVAQVHDTLAGPGARHFYRITVRGLTAGLTMRKAHRLRWLPESGDQLPEWLEGADVVETFSVSPTNADFKMRVTLVQPAVVYVFNDERQPVPAWLRERFTDTGVRLLLERLDLPTLAQEGIVPRPFAVWKSAPLPPGEVELGPQIAPDQTSQGRMYGFAAKALP